MGCFRLGLSRKTAALQQQSIRSTFDIAMSNSFSLLTLNCFGLWLPDTRRRLIALAKELEQSCYDVVCLQEIQLHSYQRLLIEGCTSYPYPVYESYVHCPKGGLLTLSQTRLAGYSFEPYAERGLWYTPMLLDRLFLKGMLITRLIWKDTPLVIINTHLLANFAGDWERYGMYARVEEKQLQQLAETVRAQPEDAILLVAGDFNVPRGSRLYRDFLVHSGLTDLLAGDARPTLRLPRGMPARFALPIDYALVRVPEKLSLTIDCDLCFSEKYLINRKRHGYLSDHHGIALQITAN
jgi:endonuclease/exonuclease/phosphatase family metal-dependent hydrolase